MLALNVLILSLAGAALGHGDHAQSEKPLVDENANWMTKHMAGKTNPRRGPFPTPPFLKRKKSVN
jgi:hypothetical protein